MTKALDEARTIELARDKNPRVGAVVVNSQGHIVGRGFHRGSGTAHAEVVALKQAGDAARGATVYSTLEPCNGQGMQGPCVQALVAAGVSHVVYAQRDPNTLMAGGESALRAAGIDVTSGVLADDAQALNESWTFAQRNERPWVKWKTATTLDGFIAASDGSSQWITGEDSRAMVQMLRSQVGAIVTGTGTVLADNPHLTVRDSDEQPLRLVIGTRPIPQDFHLADSAIQYSGDLNEVLTQLWREHGVHSVLVEAGQGLSASLWRKELVDEVFWFQAPLIAGSGVPAIGDFGVTTLDQALRISNPRIERVGLDLLIHFRTRGE